MKEVAYQFKINKSGVCWISSPFRQANNVERKPGSSGLGKSTACQDRQMVKTAVDITNYANEQSEVSIGFHTARNRLREANLLARSPDTYTSKYG